MLEAFKFLWFRSNSNDSILGIDRNLVDFWFGDFTTKAKQNKNFGMVLLDVDLVLNNGFGKPKCSIDWIELIIRIFSEDYLFFISYRGCIVMDERDYTILLLSM